MPNEIMFWIFVGPMLALFLAFVVSRVWLAWFSPEAHAWKLGYMHFDLDIDERESEFFRSSLLRFSYRDGWHAASEDAVRREQKILLHIDKARLKAERDIE